MPLTFAHPAAVLPLYAYARSRLPLAALIIGSMAPDFGYFVGALDWATQAHSLGGVLLVWPSGLMVYAGWRWLQADLCALLPPPHDHVWAQQAPLPALRQPRDFFRVSAALLLGGYTHVLWDSATHHGGWLVQHWPALHAPALGSAGAWFHVLQHGSTLLGLLALAHGYHRWRRQISYQPNAEAAATAMRRWARLLILCGLALLTGALAAYGRSRNLQGQWLGPAWVFHWVRYSTDVALVLGLMLIGWNRRTA